MAFGDVYSYNYSCFYSRSQVLDVGSFLYTNSSLTTPVSANFYSDGNYYYTVSGSCGEIVAKGVCDYNMNELLQDLGFLASGSGSGL